MKKNNSLNRFSTRVADYIKYRPHYPGALYAFLKEEEVLTNRSVVADVGSGTGILSSGLTEFSRTVYGIEPNDEMRRAGDQLLAERDNFISIKGTDVDTTLESCSIDCVFAAQAFHWFDPAAFRAECKRILKPRGKAVLLWNRRLRDCDPFHVQYEELLHRHAIDYKKIHHRYIRDKDFEVFFGQVGIEPKLFDNRQSLKLEGLTGRLFSSSYLPERGSSAGEKMFEDAKLLFLNHQVNDRVEIKYHTILFINTLN